MYVHTFINNNIKGNQVIFEAKYLGTIDIIGLDNDVSLDGNLIFHQAAYKHALWNNK